MDRVSVRLLAHYDKYNPGEFAGFSPEKAAELIEAGIAEELAETRDPVAETRDPVARVRTRKRKAGGK